jgi:lycopene cyclase domain-containing protein
MPEYTILAGVAVVVVIASECLVIRSGIFRTVAYWLTVVIVLAMQVPVDGWLTKLDAPLVQYASSAIIGIRGPWDIPIEDFFFGYALITSVLIAWEAARRRENASDRKDGREVERVGAR